MIARAANQEVLRALGLAIAIASVVLPALPLGPLFAQPPLPLAALWAAYGWAAEGEGGVSAPVTLAGLGLLHDQLAGGPYGLFVTLYLSAYLAGRVAAAAMASPNLFSLWGGFFVTVVATVVVAWLVAPLGLGRNAPVRPYAEAAFITALLFPLVRPLYMGGGGPARAGVRR